MCGGTPTVKVESVSSRIDAVLFILKGALDQLNLQLAMHRVDTGLTPMLKTVYKNMAKVANAIESLEQAISHL